MDLRQIRYFVAAFEEGSFSAAAERLHCTASGVSQQMSGLEARLGVSLFDRNRRGVTPSAAGRRFYDRCLAVLRAVSEAQIEIQDFSAGQSGSVSAGFAPGLARAVLPGALAQFTRAFEAVDLNIASGTADALLDQTATGELDFYVGQFIRQQAGLTALPLGRYPVALISGARLGLTPRVPVSLEKMSLKLFLPSARNSLLPKIEDAIRHGEIVMERSISCASLSAGLEFLSQTDWTAVLPFWIGLQELNNERLTINPVASPALDVELAMIHPTQHPLSPPARHFFEMFQTELESFETEWQKFVSQS